MSHFDEKDESGLCSSPKQHFAEKTSITLQFHNDAELAAKKKKLDIGGKNAEEFSSVVSNQKLDIDSGSKFVKCVFNNCTFNYNPCNN